MLQNLRINQADLLRAAATSPQYRTYAVAKAEELKKVAIAVYVSQERHDNEARTSETTPPKYLMSWEIKASGPMNFLLINTDPSAMWVEFGAHAGGRTAVLGYRPLTRSLQIVGARESR